jgi:hypothetical protein
VPCPKAGVYYAQQQGNGTLKQHTLILLMIAAISGCAGNPASNGEGSEGVAETSETKRKKVCSYERSSNAGSRMERVCRWEDVSED